MRGDHFRYFRSVWKLQSNWTGQFEDEEDEGEEEEEFAKNLLVEVEDDQYLTDVWNTMIAQDGVTDAKLKDFPWYSRIM